VPELGEPAKFLGNREVLDLFLRYHTVPGTLREGDLGTEAGAALRTAAAGPDGSPLELAARRERVTPRETRLVIESEGGLPASLVRGATDIPTCGGTVHLVDQVLSPVALDVSVLERAFVEELVAAGRLPASALPADAPPGIEGLPGPGSTAGRGPPPPPPPPPAAAPVAAAVSAPAPAAEGGGASSAGAALSALASRLEAAAQRRLAWHEALELEA